MSTATSYFTRLSDRTFAATPLVGGAWKEDEQHIAAPMGLLAHLIEQDHAARGGSLVVSRVTFDILGVIPLDVCEVEVRVVRAGRTIELVEASLLHAGRPALIARAWLLAEHDTREIAGGSLAPITPRDRMQPWHFTEDWAGAFVDTLEFYRRQVEPGRAEGWARARFPLLDGEAVSLTARVLGTIDTANGLTPRRSPREVLFPNLDLTVTLFRTPVSEWVGYDTTVTFGDTGRGLTHTILHDDAGPLGAITQSLTVRPIAPAR